jgi:outer membrane protein assembly factor BamB
MAWHRFGFFRSANSQDPKKSSPKRYQATELPTKKGPGPFVHLQTQTRIDPGAVFALRLRNGVHKPHAQHAVPNRRKYAVRQLLARAMCVDGIGDFSVEIRKALEEPFRVPPTIGERRLWLLEKFLAGRPKESALCHPSCATRDGLNPRVAIGYIRPRHRFEYPARLLLFDNSGSNSRSTIYEFNLADWSVVWSYNGTDEQPFNSPRCGTAQRLEDGNTLVTESSRGRAFEITPEGEIVWEFHNPHRFGSDQRLVSELFELVRLPQGFVSDWATTPAA